jgi:hypothetical protein
MHSPPWHEEGSRRSLLSHCAEAPQAPLLFWHDPLLHWRHWPLQLGPFWPLGVSLQPPLPLQASSRQVPAAHSFLRSSLAL